MQKKDLFIFSLKSLSVLLVMILTGGCFLNGPEEGEASARSLQISFSAPAAGRFRAAEGEIASVLISIKDSTDYLIFNKAKFAVYPMGSMYISEAILFTGRDGAYRITEFLVLDHNERVVYAAPLAGSEAASLVGHPLPVSFSVQRGEVNTLPLEVIEVDSSQNPSALGYFNLGFKFAQTSLTGGLQAEYMFCGDYLDTGGQNNNFQTEAGVIGDDRWGNPANSCRLSSAPGGLELTRPLDCENLTISLWFEYQETGGDSISLAGESTGDYQHLMLLESTGELGFFNGSWISSGRSLAPGSWYHAAAVYETGQVRLYLNGEKILERTQGFSNQAHPLARLAVVSGALGSAGLSALDDVKLYNRSLSGREIEMLFGDSAPQVELTYPVEDSIVSGTLIIEAEAQDHEAVVRVEFYIDGAYAGQDAEAPYTCSWNTAEAVNATHRLQALAFDTIGNPRLSAAILVSVNNAVHKTIRTLSAGENFSLALLENGTIRSWGINNEYQLGDGTGSQQNSPVRVNGLSNVVSVASGSHFSLALKNDGTVWGWGSNDYGQLGDTSTLDKAVPVKVSQLSGIIAITCGARHALALAEDGTVWGWGDNNNGELGLGDTTHRYTPVPLPVLPRIVALAAGSDSSLLLTREGTLLASGYNGYGQLGDGSTTQRTNFQPVRQLDNVIDIAAGSGYYLALLNDGTIRSWGYNGYGSLGNGQTGNQTLPVKVNGLSGVIALAAGNQQSFALKQDGSLWGWGYNTNGEVGDDTTLSKYSPVKVKNLTDVIAITTSYNYHSLALSSNGTLTAWGYNGYGQLGTGDTTPRSLPVPVSGLSQIAGPDIDLIPELPYTPAQTLNTISAGSFHAVFLDREDGTVWCWGYNGNGELGDGSTTTRTSPVRTALINGIIAVAAGSRHTLALSSTGNVYSWGLNNYGQLGDGTTTDRNAPGLILTGSRIVAIAAGGGYNGSYGYTGHSLALTENGKVLAWGYNTYGSLGDCTATHRSSPVEVNGLSRVSKIACGFLFSMALKADGTVWTWGHNANQELGDGSTNNKYAPVMVEDLRNVVAIAAGGYHAMALKADGTIVSWGYNGYGQLGDATTTNRATPVTVNGLANVTAIACGFNHSLALCSDGTFWGWGYNGYGNLGDGTTLLKHTPGQISSLSNVEEFCGSHGYDNTYIYSFTLALREDDSVKAWGYNGHGELGNGNAANSSVPVDVLLNWAY